MKTSEIVASVIIVAFIVVLLVFGVYPDLREGPRQECAANLKQMTTCISLYCGDWAGTFPPAENWCDLMHALNYIDNPAKFVCPEASPSREELASVTKDPLPVIPLGYSLFAALPEQSTEAIANASKTPLFFDSKVYGRNSVANLDSLDFRHIGRTAIIMYADGHAETVTQAPQIPEKLFKEVLPGLEDEGFEDGKEEHGDGAFSNLQSGEGAGDGHNH